MAGNMTLRDLVDRARTRGRAKTEPPRSMSWLAAKCGISRVHLYNLCTGAKAPQPHTVHKLALGLNLTPGYVARAIKRTRAEAGFFD